VIAIEPTEVTHRQFRLAGVWSRGRLWPVPQVECQHLIRPETPNDATVHFDGIGSTQSARIYSRLATGLKGASGWSMPDARWLSADAVQDLASSW
jgi:hypothetical protein